MVRILGVGLPLLKVASLLRREVFRKPKAKSGSDEYASDSWILPLFIEIGAMVCALDFGKDGLRTDLYKLSPTSS